MTTLHDFWASFDRAWDSHRSSAVVAHFDESCLMSFIDGRTFKGRKEVESFYRDAFSKMRGDLIHRASIEEEAGSTGHGTFRIFSPDGKTDVLMGRYEIELSSQRLILRLFLKRIEPSKL